MRYLIIIVLLYSDFTPLCVLHVLWDISMMGQLRQKSIQDKLLLKYKQGNRRTVSHPPQPPVTKL